MKKGDLLNIIDHLEYLLDTFRHGVEDDYEDRKRRVEKDKDSFEKLYDSFEGIDVRDPETELIIVPAKVVDWNKSGKKTLVMGHEAVATNITATDTESGDKRQVGKVIGYLGGGIQVKINDDEKDVDYRFSALELWNAVCQQTGREDLIINKTKDTDDTTES